MEVTTFWCTECVIDVEAIAHTRVLNKILGKIKEAECPQCNGYLRRFPDAPWFDSFYQLSRGIKIQRRAHKKDTLQMNDPLFDVYYPQHKRERNEKEEAEAKKEWERKQSLI